ASGSAVGYLTWACNTGNVDIELEFLSPSGSYNIGIVSRFVSTNNYYYVNFKAQTITLQSKVSGTTTSLGSVSGGPPSGLQNLFRVGLRVRDSSLIAYEGDTERIVVNDTNIDSTNGSHGVWINAGTGQDTGSLVQLVSIKVPNRYGP